MTPTRAASTALLASALALATPSCLDAPDYFYGYDLVDVRLTLYRLDMGVHPSQSVLDDPNNPFRFDGVGSDMKWVLLEYANSSAAFYAWATLLATQPNGEHQYYTALTLQRIYDNTELSPVELPFVRQMALDGYAVVLNTFPESVSFDPSGNFAFRLAPLAYQGILDLGGTPPFGWEVVDGVVLPVPSEAQNAPAAEEEE